VSDVCIITNIESRRLGMKVVYIHVTVHHNIFLFNNQPDALIIQIYSLIKLNVFGHLFCPSSGVFYCTFGTGKFHAGLMIASKQSSILTLLGNGHQTCMKLTGVECK